MTAIATRTHKAGDWEQYPYIPGGCLCYWSGFRDPGCTSPLPMGTLRLANTHPDCPHLTPLDEGNTP